MRSLFLLFMTAVIIGSSVGNVGCTSTPTAVGNNELAPVTPSAPETAANLEAAANRIREIKPTTYAVPDATDRKGRVDVRNLGVQQLRTKERGGTLPAIHIEMTVANIRGDLGWNIDARLQQLVLDDGKKLRPAFVSVSRSGQQTRRATNLPFIPILQNETKQIHLFYPLPEDRRSPGSIQAFAFDWQLISGNQLVSRITDFGSLGLTSEQVDIGSVRPPEGFSRESESGSTLGPDSDPSTPSPPIGIQTDWWQDPFADLPFPWRDVVR